MAETLKAPPVDIADGAALFLDFDGTLVELADAPGAIFVPVALASLLGRLSHRLDRRLAILSGRSLADLERHLDCAGLAVAGSHGLEIRLPDGTSLPLSTPPGLNAAREQAAQFAAGIAGLLVEDKPMSIAIHYRQVPAEADRVSAFAADLADASGLTLQHGKMVAELRTPGADKGDALRIFMKEPEFDGARPLFVGDDLTDEHGFEAAAALGGGGILVGAERQTAARWRLADVEAAARWLEQVASDD